MNCPECKVPPGKTHEPGCDVEPCPECGHQLISCGCISRAPSRDAWNKVWGDRLVPWSGEWPGLAECREFGWYCRPESCQWGMWSGWMTCPPDHPEAREDLNRLATEAVWDRDAQRFVLPDRSGNPSA